MTKELKRLSILMLAMFLALFGSTSVIQVVAAQSLSENADNRRALYDSYEVQRGSILVDGTAIATSVASDDVYSWQRTYTDADTGIAYTGNPETLDLYVKQVIESGDKAGSYSIIITFTGVI